MFLKLLNAVGLTTMADLNNVAEGGATMQKAIADDLAFAREQLRVALDRNNGLAEERTLIETQLADKTAEASNYAKQWRDEKAAHEATTDNYTNAVNTNSDYSVKVDELESELETLRKQTVVTGFRMVPTANVGKVTAWTLTLECVALGMEHSIPMRKLAASKKSRDELDSDGEMFAMLLEVPFTPSGLK